MFVFTPIVELNQDFTDNIDLTPSNNKPDSITSLALVFTGIEQSRFTNFTIGGDGRAPAASP